MRLCESEMDSENESFRWSSKSCLSTLINNVKVLWEEKETFLEKPWEAFSLKWKKFVFSNIHFSYKGSFKRKFSKRPICSVYKTPVKVFILPLRSLFLSLKHCHKHLFFSNLFQNISTGACGSRKVGHFAFVQRFDYCAAQRRYHTFSVNFSMIQPDVFAGSFLAFGQVLVKFLLLLLVFQTNKFWTAAILNAHNFNRLGRKVFAYFFKAPYGCFLRAG